MSPKVFLPCLAIAQLVPNSVTSLVPLSFLGCAWWWRWRHLFNGSSCLRLGEGTLHFQNQYRSLRRFEDGKVVCAAKAIGTEVTQQDSRESWRSSARRLEMRLMNSRRHDGGRVDERERRVLLVDERELRVRVARKCPRRQGFWLRRWKLKALGCAQLVLCGARCTK